VIIGFAQGSIIALARRFVRLGQLLLGRIFHQLVQTIEDGVNVGSTELLIGDALAKVRQRLRTRGNSGPRTDVELAQKVRGSMSGNRPPIPDEISDAFGEAVVLLVQWKGGAGEPIVMLNGKSLRITTVFDIVIDRRCTDRMPESMVKLLLTYASQEQSRRPQYDQLKLLPIYEIGARCLLKWTRDKSTS
jgi:hypothetical protein